jgi:hypothetical protein
MLKSINLKTAVVALALGGLIAAPASSQAGTETKASKNVIEETKTSAITGDLGVNFVSEYVTRGIVEQNQGVIAQPYADIYFRLYKGDGAINNVSFQLGVWDSIQSHRNEYNRLNGNTFSPGNWSGNGVKAWFESDYTAAVAVTFLKNWTSTFSYIEADYPSDQFEANRNLQLGLAFNDADYLGAFALHPHVNVLYELNTNATGAAGLKKAGWYYEVGLAPTYTFLKDSKYPITATLPITVGLGDSNGFYGGNYNGNNVYGYFTTGLNASVPLAFIPSSFGAWTTNAGFNYYNLGTSTQQYSGSGTGGVTGATSGAANQWVFSGGIGMTF